MGWQSTVVSLITFAVAMDSGESQARSRPRPPRRCLLFFPPRFLPTENFSFKFLLFLPIMAAGGRPLRASFQPQPVSYVPLYNFGSMDGDGVGKLLMPAARL